MTPGNEADRRAAPSETASIPDATVVVIVFNDEERVGTAIESALAQTLQNIEVIVVDHGSTDASALVAHRAAAADPRVRVIELGDNEGKPGRPINAGLDSARAAYATVLGSDDWLYPDACERMLTLAQQHSADVVVGGIERKDMGSGTSRRWRSDVVTRMVLHGIDENPEVIADTTGGGKLYRLAHLREHELHFPADIYYQDQVFTLGLYATARSIVVEPSYVYQWRRWPDAKRASVTQSRFELENVRDRITANRLIDEYLEAGQHPVLQQIKDAKFITADLTLYVRDLPHRSEPFREAFLEIVGPYVATIGSDRRKALNLGAMHRAMMQCIKERRMDALVSLATLATPRNVVSVELDHDSGTWILPSWRNQPDPVRVDVTRERLLDLPLVARAPLARTTVRPKSRRRWRFETSLRCGVDGLADLTGCSLEVVDPATRLAVSSIPLRMKRVPGGVDASADLGWADLGLDEASNTVLSLRLALTRSTGLIQSRPVLVEPGTRLVLERGLLDKATAALSTQVEEAYLELTPGTNKKWNDKLATVAAQRQQITPARFRKVVGIRPTNPALVEFESRGGRGFDDGLLELSRELSQSRPDVSQHWLVDEGVDCTPLPASATPVIKGTEAHARSLAAARVVFDDGWFRMPAKLVEEAGPLVVQLFSGAPPEGLRGLPNPDSPAFDRTLASWAKAVSSGAAFEQAVQAQLGRELPAGTWIRTGSPRTARLRDASNSSDLRALWGLTERTVILHVTDTNDSALAESVTTLAEQLGPQYYWLHVMLNGRYRRPKCDPPAWFYRNASRAFPFADVMRASAMLITDVSSVSADYALLGRPVLNETALVAEPEAMPESIRLQLVMPVAPAPSDAMRDLDSADSAAQLLRALGIAQDGSRR